MCSYAGVTPSDRKPRLYLRARDRAVLEQIPFQNKPRIAICPDHLDPLRHWPVDRWRKVARILEESGAQVFVVGAKDHLGVGIDLVGDLTMRETAAVLGQCALFVGNNSGLFHYAQAAGAACVTLFSLARPERFYHPGATVYPVRSEGLPCLECMSRCFGSMQQTGCIAQPRGRCMTDISVEQVLTTIDRALQDTMVATPC